MSSREDLLVMLASVREELVQVRQATSVIRDPEFLEELGLALLKRLVDRLTEVADSRKGPPKQGKAPVGYAGAPLSPLPLTPAEDYDRALASIPVPGLVVNADGLIVAANTPAEELFGKSLLHTHVDELAPDRHRGQHAYWRKGFIAHPSMRLMGRGRSVPGLRADGVEMDLDVALAPFPAQPGFTLALMAPKSAR